MLIASVGTIVICLLLTSSLGLKFVPPRKARYGRMSGAQRHFFVPNRCYIDSSPHASPTFSDTQMRYENSFRRWFLICPPLRWPFPKRQLLNLCSLLANALSNTPQYAPLPWYNLAAIPSGLPVLYWLRCFGRFWAYQKSPTAQGPRCPFSAASPHIAPPRPITNTNVLSHLRMPLSFGSTMSRRLHRCLPRSCQRIVYP